MNELREIVKQLIAGREAAGLSQSKLAKVIGTSQTTIAQIELGFREPKFTMLQRYAKAVNLTLKVQLVPRHPSE